jgi:hypothetical protein
MNRNGGSVIYTLGWHMSSSSRSFSRVHEPPQEANARGKGREWIPGGGGSPEGSAGSPPARAASTPWTVIGTGKRWAGCSSNPAADGQGNERR